jgi:tetratricopeptide (TPR) repeat protein
VSCIENSDCFKFSTTKIEISIGTRRPLPAPATGYEKWIIEPDHCRDMKSVDGRRRLGHILVRVVVAAQEAHVYAVGKNPFHRFGHLASCRLLQILFSKTGFFCSASAVSINVEKNLSSSRAGQRLLPKIKLKRAENALADGKYEEALQLYEEMGRETQLTAEARSQLFAGQAEALFHLKRFDESISAWEKVIALRPDDPFAHQNLALVLSESGKLREAAERLQELFKIDPDNSGSQAGHGESAEKNGGAAGKLVDGRPRPSTRHAKTWTGAWPKLQPSGQRRDCAAFGLPGGSTHGNARRKDDGSFSDALFFCSARESWHSGSA